MVRHFIVSDCQGLGRVGKTRQRIAWAQPESQTAFEVSDPGPVSSLTGNTATKLNDSALSGRSRRQSGRQKPGERSG